MIRKQIVLFVLLPVLVCAGPCEMVDDGETDETDQADGGDTDTGCMPEQCIDRVEVVVVRGDNGLFEDGQYAFAGTYPDGAWVTAICMYDSATLQLACDNQGMIASIDPNRSKINLLFHGAPETLAVEIAYNGISVGVVDLVPNYAPGEDEDPACPSACRSAEEIIAIQAL